MIAEHAQPGPPSMLATGFKRMMLGAMEVIALHDGTLRRARLEAFLRNAPLEPAKALQSSQNLSTEHVNIPFPAFGKLEAAGKGYQFVPVA